MNVTARSVALTVALVAFAGPSTRAIAAGPHSGRVSLQIDNVVGELGDDWPIYCGVPLARGTLSDPRHARVIDAQGRPVPAQTRVMATWPASNHVRWLGIDFQGDPDGHYALEFGPHVTAPDALTSDRERLILRKENDVYVVDTGPARFLVPEQGPLIRAAYLDRNGDGRFDDQELVIANESGDDLYVLDHTGREAIIGRDRSREQVQAEPAVSEIQQQSASLRATLRREGWYVTDDGQQVARHITRLHFYRGHSFVRIEHTLVLTEDTDNLWFRDIGVRFRHQLDDRQSVRFAPPEHGPEGIFETALEGDVQAVSLLQARGPYFSQMDLEKHARYTVDAFTGEDEPHQLTGGALAGDWVSVDDARSAVTLTLRQLWQQFPKELRADRKALTAFLWSSRGGWEFDLRHETLLKRWPKDWLNEKYHGQGSYGVYYDRLLQSSDDGQGMAKTHEILLHLHQPEEQAWGQRVAEAFSRPVLALADPQQLYQSEAMGPIAPRDTDRFPKAEGFSEAYFDQYMGVIRSWGDYGFIDYGSGPHVWYRIAKDGPLQGRWMPYVARYSGQWDYGFHSHLWRMYARSGQRKYLDYAEETNRQRMDLAMVHWDGPNAYADTSRGLQGKYRGGFSSSSGLTYWGGSSSLHHNSGTDLRKLYWYYYLRDYRRAHDVAEEYRALVKRVWESDSHVAFTGTRPFATLSNLGTLYQETGDPTVLKIGRAQLERFADLESPQGVTPDLPTVMGKYGTKIAGVEHWYEATGDSLAEKVLLRGAETYARTSMGDQPMAYYNAFGRVANRAYRITGDPLYARTLQRNMDLAVAMYYDFEKGQWKDMLEGSVSAANNVYPLGDMAMGMDAIRRAGDEPDATPAVQQTGRGRPVLAVFRKPVGQSVKLDVRGRYPLRPRVLTLDGEPVEGVRCEPFREQLYSLEKFDPSHTYDVHVPAELPEGDYLLDSGIGGAPWEVTWTSAPQIVLYAPGGVRVGCGSTWMRRFQPGSAPEAAPITWRFQVPAGAEQFEIYHSSAVDLRAPDGTRIQLDEPLQWRSLPVAPDQAGKLWRFTAHRDAFVELRGVPPALAGGSDERFFLPNFERIPAERLGMQQEDLSAAVPMTDGEAIFVPGALLGAHPGQGLALTGARALRVPRGKSLGEGRFERFNAREGTLELWFQPNWSSVYESWGAGREKHLLDASPWFIKLQEKSEPRGLFRVPGTSGQVQSLVGVTFERWRWTHLAWQWFEDEEGHFVVETYIDGKLENVGYEQARARALEHGEPHLHRAASQDWMPDDPGEVLVFGRHQSSGLWSLDGVIDEMRISDGRRYEGDFSPARDRPLSADKHTLVLFDFEGKSIGVAGDGSSVPTELTE
ncbi:MAG TPA: hypothetical protein VGN57_01520 [Pirellulaceae bacterium]|jgi:hypothetical protein|nr:hypothetical protein [Pirellulaceae bacterium]